MYWIIGVGTVYKYQAKYLILKYLGTYFTNLRMYKNYQ